MAPRSRINPATGKVETGTPTQRAINTARMVTEKGYKDLDEARAAFAKNLDPLRTGFSEDDVDIDRLQGLSQHFGVLENPLTGLPEAIRLVNASPGELRKLGLSDKDIARYGDLSPESFDSMAYDIFTAEGFQRKLLSDPTKRIPLVPLETRELHPLKRRALEKFYLDYSSDIRKLGHKGAGERAIAPSGMQMEVLGEAYLVDQLKGRDPKTGFNYPEVQFLQTPSGLYVPVAPALEAGHDIDLEFVKRFPQAFANERGPANKTPLMLGIDFVNDPKNIRLESRASNQYRAKTKWEDQTTDKLLELLQGRVQTGRNKLGEQFVLNKNTIDELIADRPELQDIGERILQIYSQ